MPSTALQVAYQHSVGAIPSTGTSRRLVLITTICIGALVGTPSKSSSRVYDALCMWLFLLLEILNRLVDERRNRLS